MTTCPQESLTVIVIVIDEKVMMVRVEVFESWEPDTVSHYIALRIINCHSDGYQF